VARTVRGRARGRPAPRGVASSRCCAPAQARAVTSVMDQVDHAKPASRMRTSSQITAFANCTRALLSRNGLRARLTEKA
jgi:hypothetical protein